MKYGKTRKESRASRCCTSIPYALSDKMRTILAMASKDDITQNGERMSIVLDEGNDDSFAIIFMIDAFDQRPPVLNSRTRLLVSIIPETNETTRNDRQEGIMVARCFLQDGGIVLPRHHAILMGVYLAPMWLCLINLIPEANRSVYPEFMIVEYQVLENPQDIDILG